MSVVKLYSPRPDGRVDMYFADRSPKVAKAADELSVKGCFILFAEKSDGKIHVWCQREEESPMGPASVVLIHEEAAEQGAESVGKAVDKVVFASHRKLYPKGANRVKKPNRNSIEFTECLRPTGIRRTTFIDRTGDIAAAARELRKEGVTLTVERLSPTSVALCCEYDEEDLVTELVEANDAALFKGVDDLVVKSHNILFPPPSLEDMNVSFE